MRKTYVRIQEQGCICWDPENWNPGNGTNYPGIPAFLVWWLEDGHVPTFKLLVACNLTQQVQPKTSHSNVPVTYFTARVHRKKRHPGRSL